MVFNAPRLRSAGATAIFRSCEEPNSTLNTLLLNDCSLDNRAARAAARALISPHCRLTHLTLEQSSQLGDKAADLLGLALRDNERLEELSLRRNAIGDRGARSLSDGLRYNRSLRSLDLSGNCVGCEGAKCIAEVLQHSNRTLKVLRLGSQQQRVRPAGSSSKMKMKTIKKEEEEEERDAAYVTAAANEEEEEEEESVYTPIGDRGAFFFARLLMSRAVTLWELDLRGCDIG